jgi:hypothetical protein
MAETPRGRAFDEHEPALSDDEIAQAVESDRAALSLKGKPVLHATGAIQFLAVKFALTDGTFETLLLDRLAANALLALISATNQVDWDGRAMRPGPVRN